MQARQRGSLARGVVERGVLAPAMNVVKDGQSVNEEQNGAGSPDCPRVLSSERGDANGAIRLRPTTA